ncbi:unnamed protein product [Urochloa humidicola]
MFYLPQCGCWHLEGEELCNVSRSCITRYNVVFPVAPFTLSWCCALNKFFRAPERAIGFGGMIKVSFSQQRQRPSPKGS